MKKNGEKKNCNIFKTWCFLIVLFVLPLCCNECERVAATAEQKMVCGLQYHRSRVRIQSSKLIEKMASKKTVTPSKLGVFSPLFFVLPLCCNERERVAATAEQKTVCGLQYPRSRVSIKSSELIEKMVSKTTVTSSKLGVFSLFFLLCRSAVMNASRWQQQRSKGRSVGFNTTDCAKDVKTVI